MSAHLTEIEQALTWFEVLTVNFDSACVSVVAGTMFLLYILCEQLISCVFYHVVLFSPPFLICKTEGLVVLY
jgi:hypothetical protein